MMYRGCRLKDHEIEYVKSHGMSYYWESPYSAISQIFSALRHFGKISRLGRTEVLQSYILEPARPGRLQLWATSSEDNANSYARGSPELIASSLRAVGIERNRIVTYLDFYYGSPFVIKFNWMKPHNEYNINEPVGIFIPPKDIVSVTKVDMDTKDPWMEKLCEAI